MNGFSKDLLVFRWMVDFLRDLGFSKGFRFFSGSGYVSLLTVQRCTANTGFET